MSSIADEAVVSTNDDAALCKYRAVILGYYYDPFIEKFLSTKAINYMEQKAPEINRGYYVRSTSISCLVEKFILQNPTGQIISLGAGFDTLFWRLNANNFINNAKPRTHDSQSYVEEETTEDRPVEGVKYVEIDMSSVVDSKILSIKRNPDIFHTLSRIRVTSEGLFSDNYNLFSFDLRQVDKKPLWNKLIEECHLDTTKPTLCLAECVLVYMPIQDSTSLIKWFSETFNNLTVLNYEQCNMNDRFGEIMLENMNARHCDLMGVEACRSLETQMNRLKSNNLNFTKGWTLLEVLKKCLLPDMVRTAFRIEFLDENELLDQLLEHYCIVIGSHNELDWIPESEYWLPQTRQQWQ